MNTSKQTLKRLVGNLAVASFMFGGWILFAFSEISKNDDAASQISAKTKIIRDTSYYEYNRLKSEIASLGNSYNQLTKSIQSERDSAEFYRMFYDIMNLQYKFKYDFEKKQISSNEVEYTGCITDVSPSNKDSIRMRVTHSYDSVKN